MTDDTPKVADGLELVDGFCGEEYACARCGGSTEYVRCWECGGSGFTHHDCGEDSCPCLHPEDNVRCESCAGIRAYHCTNSPQWCEAHPLPGREHVRSTALSNQAWSDVYGD